MGRDGRTTHKHMRDDEQEPIDPSIGPVVKRPRCFAKTKPYTESATQSPIHSDPYSVPNSYTRKSSTQDAIDRSTPETTRDTASPECQVPQLSSGVMKAIQSGHLSADFVRRFQNQSAVTITPMTPESNVSSPPEFYEGCRQCQSDCEENFEDIASYREHIATQHAFELVLCKHADCPFNLQKDKMAVGNMTRHYITRHDAILLQCQENPNVCDYETHNEEYYGTHVEKCKRKCRFCWAHNSRANPWKDDSALQAHIKKEHIINPNAEFPCTAQDFATGKQCTRGFSSLKNLQRHMTTKHPGPYDCPYCKHTAVEFNSERNLALHVQATHSMEYNDQWAVRANIQVYVCPYPNCGKEFNRSHNLKVHVESKHEKSKLFKCSEIDLNGHSKMVDGEGEALIWIAELSGCEMAFGGKQALVDHVRTAHLGLKRWQTFAEKKKGIIKVPRRAETPRAADVLTGVISGDEKD